MERPPKWQRNSIYNAVVEGGLAPAECAFDYDEAEWRLTHVPSQSYFLLQGDASRYTTTTVVGDNPSSSGTTNAVGLPLSVRQWALQVRFDADTPDRWAELRRHQRIVMSVVSEGVENTPFSQEEQAEILEQLGAIKEDTKKLEPLSERSGCCSRRGSTKSPQPPVVLAGKIGC